MKIVREWLEELLDVSSYSDEEIASALTRAGTEVASYGPLSGATNVVVGRIVTCDPLEGSDHLHVLQVDVGEGSLRQIVCGAPNARAGLLTAVALPGASLPGGIKIKEGKLRGVDSLGMCCSTLELGLDEKFVDDCDKTGIHEFPDDAGLSLGEDAIRALGLSSTVFDLEVLSNRSDLLSYEGVARELSACLGIPYIEKERAHAGTRAPSVKPASTTEKCPSFLLLEARGIKRKTSPEYIKRRLLASGIRSLSFLVDVGNYAMLLTGQPLNVYDLDKLKSDTLTARDDYEGKFLTMDEKERESIKGDILIMDGDTPACLAGIMTTLTSTIDGNSVNVAVEAASFSGKAIRSTSQRLGLSSESSLRFGKGIDPSISRKTLEIVARLLKEEGGADEVSAIASYGETSMSPKEIPFSIEKINARLGTSFEDEKILDALRRDHIEIKKTDRAYLAVVPTYRKDVLEEADLSEEAIRLIGIDEIPSVLPHTVLPYAAGKTEERKKLDRVRSYLRSVGLDETVSYSLVDKKTASYRVYEPGEDVVPLNPITEEHSILRQDVLPSLLGIASYNASRGEENLSFFESSKVHAKGRSSLRLSLFLSGKKEGQGALLSTPVSFYDMKGLLEGIFEKLSIKEGRLRIEPLTDHSLFHPGRSARYLLGKETVAIFGEIHPRTVKELALPKPAIGCEIEIGKLLSLPSGKAKAIVPPRFPSVRRDLSVVFKDEVSHEEVVKAIKKASSLIEKVELFDSYLDSRAYALTLRKEEATLSGEEIESTVSKAIEAISRLGGEIRK